MSKLTLYDFLRAGHVKRWHIVQTIGTQTIAEHGFLTAIIALHLFQRLVGVKDDPASALTVVVAALTHDAVEVRTGDIPTPGKAYMRELAGDVFTSIEDDLMPEVPYVGGKLGVALHQFVKMADAIETAHWISDHKAGRHSEIVASGCWRRLEDLVYKYDIDDNGWYAAVNEVLGALGMPPVIREERVTPP